MDATLPNSKPDETDSSDMWIPLVGQHKADTAIRRTEAGEATASHEPANTCGLPAVPDQGDEEYSLERELDGRYRIIGRRLPKHE